MSDSLREKCPNMYFPVFRLNTNSVRIQESTNQKKLRIWTLSTQWLLSLLRQKRPKVWREIVKYLIKKNLPLVTLIKNCYPPKTQQDSITVPLYQAETKKCKHYKHCPRENFLNSENTQVSRKSSFSFSWRLFNFLNFIRTRPNMTYVTLREVWPWHLRSNIRKITDKIGLKFF